MKTRIDHIVIGADSLAQGVDYVKNCLGVHIPYGGEHVKMGTHNHLMQLGDNIFFEVIAINPEAAPPNRPRWFGLDDPFIRQQIQIEPRLLTWVVNTDNLNELIGQASFTPGNPELLSRGNLSWHFGLPGDGRLLSGGMLPYAMEWETDNHPSVNMADLGCSFQGLEIYHPYPVWFQSALDSIGAADLIKITPLPKNHPPYLAAHIGTPHGVKTMVSVDRKLEA
jgi:hypothetical protein